MRTHWHIQQDADSVILARHWPPRFDVKSCVEIAVCASDLSLPRLAHQIRQDLWRTLQNLRGFSPVVQLRRGSGHLEICAGGRAGGRTAQPVAPRHGDQITALLTDPKQQHRWICWAKRGKA